MESHTKVFFLEVTYEEEKILKILAEDTKIQLFLFKLF